MILLCFFCDVLVSGKSSIGHFTVSVEARLKSDEASTETAPHLFNLLDKQTLKHKHGSALLAGRLIIQFAPVRYLFYHVFRLV
jgi:hypothetical protein